MKIFKLCFSDSSQGDDKDSQANDIDADEDDDTCKTSQGSNN